MSWATWLLFTGVPARCVLLLVRYPGPLGSCSPVCPLVALLCVCGVLGHSAPVHRCARVVCCVACAVSWATSLLFTGVPARCVALCVRCPGPLGSCSPVCPLGALLCRCGVLGHLAPVHWCARLVCCFACALSWATWLLFTGVPARCVALRVRCPGPLGSCSPVCPLRVLCCMCGVLGHLDPVDWCARWVCCVACAVSWATWLLFTGVRARCVACVCGVLGHLAPVHRCARLVRCFACAVSWVTWLLFTGVPAWYVVLLVRCPGPLGSCSPVCPLGALFCLCGVLGHLAPVHRCARLVCCFACAVSLATWLLFTGVPAWCVVLLVPCPGPLGSCSPVCPLGALPVCAVSLATWLLFTGVPAWCVALLVRCLWQIGSCSPMCLLGALFCLCSVLGHLAPPHRCDRLVCCFACAVSWATWLLFTGVPARCVACVCGVLGHFAPVHRCARRVCCFACAVSLATWLLFTGVPAWCVVLLVPCPGPLCSCSPVCPLGALPVCAVSLATWLLFTGVPAWCVVLLVRCLGPLGSCSPVCPLGVLFCLCGVLGHLAPVHRCARSVRCFACAVSRATWLLFICFAWCVVLRVRCPGPLGSFSLVCPLDVLFCLCVVPGHLAPVHRCARSVRCFACSVSWATWLLFTGVPAWFVVLRVWCPGPLGSCSPACRLGPLFCLCGVLSHLASVHRCASSVCCSACAVSWATWLLFTGVPARCVALRVRCPGPPGSCSPVCPHGVLFACAVSWATGLLFTGVPARCVALCVRCPGPLGSCSPVCPRGLLCCVCGVLGHLAPVHRCARSLRCFACAMSWATWLLFTGVPARCVVCLCGVLGHWAPVHRCARSVRCFVCAVSWATWLLFTGVPAWFVVLRVRCPGPLHSCSPVCPLGALLCVCGVLGHLASVHRCARSVRSFACVVSSATWLLFTGVLARCVVLCVRCPGPLSCCSPVCPLVALLCVCGVLGHLAPVHRCARTVCRFACALSWATWLLFSGVPARCVAFLSHGGPPPKALHQSGLTMGKMSVHGEPKFSKGQPRVFTNLVRVKTLHELHHGLEKVKILVEAISLKDAKGYIAYTKEK